MGETNDFMARAQQGDERASAELTAPFRRELQLHCYRILGSLHDAEDLLQETLLAAWRGLSDFERRSSLRSWLYTIATNRCLNALRDSSRRPQAAGVPGGLARAENFSEIAWLEPYPDSLLEGIADSAPGPEARYEAKEAVALAFVSGLQHLAPLQRAVLGFRAAEVASMLDSTEASVNSALQRARGLLESRAPAGGAARDRLSLVSAGAHRELISASPTPFSVTTSTGSWRS
jgi:RNA polymerase sigma-70 factor (TIGR02960 family)